MSSLQPLIDLARLAAEDLTERPLDGIYFSHKTGRIFEATYCKKEGLVENAFVNGDSPMTNRSIDFRYLVYTKVYEELAKYE